MPREKAVPRPSDRFRIHAVLVLLLAVAARGGAAPCPATTPEDDALYAAKLDRLKTHANLYPDGGGIPDVLASFTNPLPITVNCPAGSAVDHLQITVHTTFAHWDAASAKAGEAGRHVFDIPAPIVEGRTKIIAFNDCIMLDPAVTAPDEADAPFGVMADEALLYHEMLHGQLMIDTLRASIGWQKKVCSCQAPTINDEDADHAVILPLEDTYLVNLAGANTSVRVVRQAAQKAGSDGKFKVDLGPTGGKTDWSFEFLHPQQDNIVSTPPDTLLLDVDENGHWTLSGKLIDATKPGYVFVRIDPESLFVAGGIERGMEILPSIPLDAGAEESPGWSFRVISPMARGGEVRFQFSTPQRTRTEIRVYDLAGREVATVLDAEVGAGAHVARWDPGTGGRDVRPAVYFARMRAGGRSLMRRVILIR